MSKDLLIPLGMVAFGVFFHLARRAGVLLSREIDRRRRHEEWRRQHARGLTSVRLEEWERERGLAEWQERKGQS